MEGSGLDLCIFQDFNFLRQIIWLGILNGTLRNSPTEKMILKPLNGYGGSGVIVLEKQAIKSFRSLVDYYISGGDNENYVILQEYVEGAEAGDVRILLLNGRPIGAMKRIPASGDIRSNVHAGGRVEKHALTEKERALCRLIGPKLVNDGLYFVGIDTINGRRIEVNILAPGGISRINRLNGVKLQSKVIDFIEQSPESKPSPQTRIVGFEKKVAAG